MRTFEHRCLILENASNRDTPIRLSVEDLLRPVAVRLDPLPSLGRRVWQGQIQNG